MERLERVAFRLNGASYRLADALLRAAIAGEWRDIEDDIRHGASCERRAEREEPPLTEADVSAALREFRYEHDLVSADEAQEWLEAWDLSAGEWRDAVIRRLLCQRWTERAPEALDDGALADIAWADLVCSGELEALVGRLAERVAIGGDAEETDPLFDGGGSHGGPIMPAWLGLSETHEHPAVRRLERMEQVYRTRRGEEVSVERVTAAIALRAFEWTHLETARLVFPTEPMAAEAALRVREDGESLADVAAQTLRPLATWRGFLDSADAVSKIRLAAARAGELLGPFPDDDGHALLQVVARRTPHADDGEVRAHAEQRLWSQITARALDRVQWEPPLVRVARG
jgi:hypothetical protein